MNVPAVSVLMTAYNREQYIAQAVESVLAQTFTDFELVIVDDRSTDGTLDVAQRYTSDPRVRVEVNDRNIGDYPNRNHAAALARGELLKFHDSDDVMYPHCLEVLVHSLSAHPTAAFALSGSRDWTGAPEPFLSTPRMSFLREYVGSGLFHLGPACALFRADAFRTLGGFPCAGVHSDLLFWLTACARVDVVLAPADLFWYRVHAGQELRSGGGHQFARLERARWNALWEPDCPLLASERELARRNQAAGILKRVVGDVRSGRWHLALFRLTQSGLGPGDWLRYARRPRRRADAGAPEVDLATEPTSRAVGVVEARG